MLDQGQIEGILGKVLLGVGTEVRQQLFAEAALATWGIEDCLAPTYKAGAEELCLSALKIRQLVERSQTPAHALPKVGTEMSEKVDLADWPEAKGALRIFIVNEADQVLLKLVCRLAGLGQEREDPVLPDTGAEQPVYHLLEVL